MIVKFRRVPFTSNMEKIPLNLKFLHPRRGWRGRQISGMSKMLVHPMRPRTNDSQCNQEWLVTIHCAKCSRYKTQMVHTMNHHWMVSGGRSRNGALGARILKTWDSSWDQEQIVRNSERWNVSEVIHWWQSTTQTGFDDSEVRHFSFVCTILAHVWPFMQR